MVPFSPVPAPTARRCTAARVGPQSSRLSPRRSPQRAGRRREQAVDEHADHQDHEHRRQQLRRPWRTVGRTPACAPSEGRSAMMTSSSPAIRLRQANAQPWVSPPTYEGRAAGRTMCRYSADGPGARGPGPSRRNAGGTWSMPEMTPLAMLGAAPRTTTNKIACSLRPNSRIASGNHDDATASSAGR